MRVSAACHIHSDWSYDGKKTLPDLAREFAGRGYRVLMLTEHDKGFSPERLAQFRTACAEATSEKILLVPGIEYSDAANTIHVLVWGSVPFLGERLPTGEMLEQVKAHNGASVLAHPSRRSAWQLFDPSWKPFLLGIEIWNRKTDGWAPSAKALGLIDDTLVPFVGMDYHTSRQMFPLAMRLELTGDVTEGTVLSCLQDRRCVAQVFGRPLQFSLYGTSSIALKLAERFRRKLARAYRVMSE
jgi:hypothetical protein